MFTGSIGSKAEHLIIGKAGMGKVEETEGVRAGVG